MITSDGGPPKITKRISKRQDIGPAREFRVLRRFRNIDDPLMRAGARAPVRYDPTLPMMGYTSYPNTITLRNPNDLITYLHELGHVVDFARREETGGTAPPGYWNEFARVAGTLSRTRAYDEPSRMLTDNPRVPDPFRVSTDTPFAWGASMTRSFPGIGSNPLFPSESNPAAWGGPPELFAQLIATAFGDRTRIPPPLRRFYDQVLGSYSRPPVLFAPSFGTNNEYGY